MQWSFKSGTQHTSICAVGEEAIVSGHMVPYFLIVTDIKRKISNVTTLWTCLYVVIVIMTKYPVEI